MFRLYPRHFVSSTGEYGCSCLRSRFVLCFSSLLFFQFQVWVLSQCLNSCFTIKQLFLSAAPFKRDRESMCVQKYFIQVKLWEKNCTEYCLLLQNTTKYLGNCHAKHTCTCYISAMAGLILASVVLAKIIKFRKGQTTGTVLGFSWIQQHGWGDIHCLFQTVPALKQELRQFFLLSGCNISFTCKNLNSCFTRIHSPWKCFHGVRSECGSSVVVFTHQMWI